ncbi:NAD(P)-dependent oxidoreductase [Paenibacillus sp. P13VS]|uniref:NAD(P)-dependent oxidoreductase n=1 Tax=Paenibacillus sp. P13VS TaxID=2697367 RepID=UPI00187BB3F9|nr:SDR family oxidoreductase [Paenibacillus sp. P13VS]MBE7680314.1 NAD(P)H-binding protein [Paenibacillus sp. P13VS]
MQILVLGATGRVGTQIVARALKEKHHVTVLVRQPEKCQVNDENLTIIQGNVLNQEDIKRAIYVADVVFSALNTDGTNTLSKSMPLIIEAMYEEGIKRIITVGTAGILQSRLFPSILRYQSSESRRKSTRAAEEHHRVYSLLQESTLDWTIVCPTYLPDGEHLGVYRVERDVLPEGGTEISVSDTAEFTYKQIKDDSYIKTRVGISY